jgi:hypothetical protein
MFRLPFFVWELNISTCCMTNSDHYLLSLNQIHEPSYEIYKNINQTNKQTINFHTPKVTSRSEAFSCLVVHLQTLQFQIIIFQI